MPNQPLNSDIAIQLALKQASSRLAPAGSDKVKKASDDLMEELKMSKENLKQIKTNPSFHEAFIKALIAELEYEMCSRGKSESKIEEISHNLAIHA